MGAGPAWACGPAGWSEGPAGAPGSPGAWGAVAAPASAAASASVVGGTAPNAGYSPESSRESSPVNGTAHWPVGAPAAVPTPSVPSVAEPIPSFAETWPGAAAPAAVGEEDGPRVSVKFH
ncbi:hypothetical protein GCM10018987_32950 [Streptomyces cremeus]